MKTTVLSLALSSLLFAVGCGGPEAGAFEPGAFETEVPEYEQEESALINPNLTPLCQDREIEMIRIEFCGPLSGPDDFSAPYVECSRTCTTDRYWAFSGNPGGPFPVLECVNGETECTAWDCPSCD